MPILLKGVKVLPASPGSSPTQLQKQYIFHQWPYNLSIFFQITYTRNGQCGKGAVQQSRSSLFASSFLQFLLGHTQNQRVLDLSWGLLPVTWTKTVYKERSLGVQIRLSSLNGKAQQPVYWCSKIFELQIQLRIVRPRHTFGCDLSLSVTVMIGGWNKN